MELKTAATISRSSVCGADRPPRLFSNEIFLDVIGRQPDRLPEQIPLAGLQPVLRH